MPTDDSGAKIRRLRRERGWTQAQLAALLDTDAVTVSRWERGVSQPRRSARARLAQLASTSGRRFAMFPVGVAMAVVNDRSEILLLEDPGTGSLEVPSGAVEAGETIVQAVRRELTEELGAEAALRPIATVHAYTIGYKPGVDLVSVVYLVAYDGGPIVPGDDAVGLTPRWFGRFRLAELDERIRVPNEPRILDRALALWTIEREADERGRG
jgi:8-oxo-dGTP pyrophosphatase MutT (NUDIX family)